MDLEYFSEEYSKLLLNKEWLVKIDSEKSVPYLMKFYASTVDLNCCILITDTRNVWGEVLSSKQFARRWSDCNPESAPDRYTTTPEDDDEWRTHILELLTAAHTLGGIMDLSFDVVDSRYADFAFEIGDDTFKWRWEAYALGPKLSADVLSKHLIMPLISVTHLAFSSADPVSELSETNLEKAVDKVGRTARRTADTHVKHALSKPRVSTTLRRMTAMFNFLPDLPSILSNADRTELVLPVPPHKSRATSTSLRARAASRSASPGPNGKQKLRAPSSSPDIPPSSPLYNSVPGQAADDGSVTELSEDDALPPPSKKAKAKQPLARSPNSKPASALRSRSPTRASPELTRQPTPDAPRTPDRTSTRRSADDSSSPLPPPKKAKLAVSSSDEDSEAERRRRVAQIKGTAQRGAKQPLKRGGRKF